MNFLKLKLIFCLCLPLLFAACSDESHEEKVARAEQEKQEQTEIAASAIKGMGNALSDAGSDAAESLSKGMTDVVSGLARGVEKGTEYDAKVSDSLTDQGVSVNVATRNMSNPETGFGEGGSENSVSIYVTFDQALDTVLQLRVYDVDNKEIGRSNKIPVSMGDDEASYVHFTFDGQTPLSRIDKIVLYETKPAAAEPTSTNQETVEPKVEE